MSPREVLWSTSRQTREVLQSTSELTKISIYHLTRHQETLLIPSLSLSCIHTQMGPLHHLAALDCFRCILARDGPVDDHETLLLQCLQGVSADGFLGHFTLVYARTRATQ
jgi:hypothetical protein